MSRYSYNNTANFFILFHSQIKNEKNEATQQQQKLEEQLQQYLSCTMRVLLGIIIHLEELITSNVDNSP